jgi:hypothetical protein
MDTPVRQVAAQVAPAPAGAAPRELVESNGEAAAEPGLAVSRAFRHRAMSGHLVLLVPSAIGSAWYPFLASMRAYPVPVASAGLPLLVYT